METTQYSAIFKALGDDTRIKIIQLLSGKSLCACQILTALEVTQPTLSHHMKVLNQVGIVKTIRVGTWSHYRLNPEFITLIQPFISAFATEDLHDETAACKP